MRRLIILLITLSVIFLTAQSFAEIPPYMQFQGKATGADDTPLNGTYNITFRIYDAETAGNLEWSETHNSVQIENGVFSVLLGGTNPLNIAFDEPYWISIDINATGEMPRQRITSAGYAYRAKEADIAERADYASVADTLASFSIPFYISGLELEYVDSKNIRTTPGTIDIGGTMLTTTDYSANLNVDIQSNYIEGTTALPDSWIYVYTYNNSGLVDYKFSINSPNKADHAGNIAGPKRYYTPDGSTYYRCIGAARLDSNDIIRKFYQCGTKIFYDEFYQFYEGGAHSYTDRDLSTYMPVFSTLAIVNIKYAASYVGLRPNGSSSTTFFYRVAPGAGGGPQIEIITDKNQIIESEVGHTTRLVLSGYDISAIR